MEKSRYVFISFVAITLLVAIAFTYYQHTQALGAHDCTIYGVQLDKDLAQQMKESNQMLGQTHYSFKNATCYQDITYTDTSNNTSTIHSYIKDVYANHTIDSCDIPEVNGTQQPSPGCTQYYADFNRLFWKLY